MRPGNREKVRAALKDVNQRDQARKEERQARFRESQNRQQSGTAKRYDRSRYVGYR